MCYPETSSWHRLMSPQVSPRFAAVLTTVVASRLKIRIGFVSSDLHPRLSPVVALRLPAPDLPIAAQRRRRCFNWHPFAKQRQASSLGRESEVTVPCCKSSCEATAGDTEPDELRSQLEQGFRFSVVAGSASEQTDRATPLRKSSRKVCNSVKVPFPPARGRRWPTGRMRGLPAVSAV